MFEDFAEFCFQILVVLESFEFAIRIGSASGAPVETAKTEVRHHIGGVVFKGAFQERDGFSRSAGRDEYDGQACLSLRISGLQGERSVIVFFRGLEITTGGQRIHRREDLERSLRERGISPSSFESHLKMFELGMPPHGGLAIGLERLTAQILGLANVREATLYPRDRFRLTP